MEKHKRLWDLYRFPAFSPEHIVSGIFGDPRARVLGLARREKKPSAGPVVRFITPFTTEKSGESAIFPAAACGCIWNWKSAGFFVASARR
jgi:hypothetical protein